MTAASAKVALNPLAIGSPKVPSLSDDLPGFRISFSA